MKHALRALLIPLLLASTALGQVVPCSGLNLTAEGGIACDTSTEKARVELFTDSTAPTVAYVGKLWLDTGWSASHPRLRVCRTVSGTSCTLWGAVDRATAITADFTTAPSTPVTGDEWCSFSASLGTRGCAIYDGTNWWLNSSAGVTLLTAGYIDTYGAPLADPTTAPGVTAVGSGGSMTAGTHCVAYSWVNATGGETLLSTVSSGVVAVTNDSFSITGITNGPAGTTSKRVYMSKAGGCATEWYLSASIADNTTTTATLTTVDTGLTFLSPKINSSGAPSVKWSRTNSGNIGSTGSGLVLRSTTGMADIDSGTTEASPRAAFDLTAWNAGDYSVQFRVNHIGTDENTNQGAYVRAAIAAVRVSSADNAIAQVLCEEVSKPLDTTDVLIPSTLTRSTVAGALTALVGPGPVNPTVTGYPYWIRLVKRSYGSMWFTSKDAINWTPQKTSPNVGTQLAFEAAVSTQPSSAWTELNLLAGSQSTASATAPFAIHIDNLTVTVP